MVIVSSVDCVVDNVIVYVEAYWYANVVHPMDLDSI